MIRALCLALLMMPALAMALDDAVDGKHRFLWNQTSRQMTSASTASEHLAVAHSLSDLISGGARNADLYYNFGTSLLQAGQYPQAIEALECAEIFEGSSSDIRRNLKLAHEGAVADGGGGANWTRTLFAWHYRLPLDARAMIASISFSVIWLALAIARLIRGYRWQPIAGLAAVICLLFASSVGASLFKVSKTVTIPDVLPEALSAVD